MPPAWVTSTHGEAAPPANRFPEIPYDANQDHADGLSFFVGINYG
jgi:hypothetical protein